MASYLEAQGREERGTGDFCKWQTLGEVRRCREKGSGFTPVLLPHKCGSSGVASVEQGGWRFLTRCCNRFLVPQGQISRGAHYTLQKNNGDIWEVADSSGDKISAPGVCFMIPPPDPDAIALADQYVPPPPLPPQPLPLPSPAPAHPTSAAPPHSGITDGGGGLLPRFPQRSRVCWKPQASSRRDSCTPLLAHKIPPGKVGPAQSHPGPPPPLEDHYVAGGAAHPSPRQAGTCLCCLSPALTPPVKTPLYPFANTG